MIHLSVIAAVLGLAWSVRARVTGSLLGLTINMPLLVIVAAVLVLVIVAAMLCIVRGIVRDWPRTVPA